MKMFSSVLSEFILGTVLIKNLEIFILMEYRFGYDYYLIFLIKNENEDGLVHLYSVSLLSLVFLLVLLLNY